MMDDEPAVNEVSRYMVSGSSTENATGLVESGPESIVAGCFFLCVFVEGMVVREGVARRREEKHKLGESFGSWHAWPEMETQGKGRLQSPRSDGTPGQKWKCRERETRGVEVTCLPRRGCPCNSKTGERERTSWT